MTIKECAKAVVLRDQISVYSRFRAALDVSEGTPVILVREVGGAHVPEKLSITKGSDFWNAMHRMFKELTDEAWRRLSEMGVTDDE